MCGAGDIMPHGRRRVDTELQVAEMDDTGPGPCRRQDRIVERSSMAR
jgi:hypothetical protein